MLALFSFIRLSAFHKECRGFEGNPEQMRKCTGSVLHSCYTYMVLGSEHLLLEPSLLAFLAVSFFAWHSILSLLLKFLLLR